MISHPARSPRRLGLLAAGVAASLMSVAGPAHADAKPAGTATGSLSTRCFGVTPVANFRHSSTTGDYWAGGTVRCSFPFRLTIVVKQLGNEMTALTKTSAVFAANQRVDINTKAFDPIPGDTYQVVVSVTASTGVSLGYITSGAPQGVGGQDLAAHARYLLNHSNYQLTGRLVRGDVQAAANNQVSSANDRLSKKLLRLIIIAGKGHTIQVSALESGGTGHSSNSYHYTGDAVDFSARDGVALSGRDAHSKAIINTLKDLMPAGSFFGQRNCGTTPSLPAGIGTFDDTCNHLHVQLPRQTA